MKTFSHKPAPLSGLLWFAFSGTAMLSAFILPVHFWALAHDYGSRLPLWYIRGYFFILFAAALYHGLYRVKTIAIDLGFRRAEHVIGWLCILFGLSGVALAAFLLLSV